MFREVTHVFPSAESEAIVNSFLKHLVSLLPNPVLHELCHGETHPTLPEGPVKSLCLVTSCCAQLHPTAAFHQTMNASEQSFWGTLPYEWGLVW